jgi:hypothetical protein
MMEREKIIKGKEFRVEIVKNGFILTFNENFEVPYASKPPADQYVFRSASQLADFISLNLVEPNGK